MLATPWPHPFEDPEWAYELKWDGVRIVLHAEAGEVRLRSRRGRDRTATFPELAGYRPEEPTVLDGEVVAVDDRGLPSFERLQQRMNLEAPALVRRAAAQVPISYVVFDVLHRGAPIIDQPWQERRALLEGLRLPEPMVRSDVYPEAGGLWSFVESEGLEGIVAKRRASPYRPGVRSPDWRKVTRVVTVRAVVGGWLPGTGSRAGTFGSLLLGLWDHGALRWIGAVGSGFDDPSLRAIADTLEALRSDRSPFHPDPELPRNARWVHPRLVAVVQAKGWTSRGRLRAPVFVGFTDEEPEAATWEAEGPISRPPPASSSPPPTP